MTRPVKLFAVVLWLVALVGAYQLGEASSAGAKAATAPALAAGHSERNPLRRSFEVSRALRGLEAEEVVDVARVVENAGFWFNSQEHHLLMSAWLRVDPVSPMDWASARPGLLGRRAQIAMIDSLGFFDPPRARGVISSLGLSQETEFLHLYMVQGWARSEHKGELTRYLEKLPQGVPRQQATRVLANEILKGGPEELIAWADEIPVDAERQFKRLTFQKAANAMAGVEPELAAQWVDEHLGQRYAVAAPKVVVLRWREEDPAAALDWLISLPATVGRRELVKQTFESWVESDTDAAQEWARRASPAAGVDPAVRVLVRKFFKTSPAVAMEWAERIHVPEIRQSVMASAGRAWLAQGRDAFLAWLPESGLEPEIRDLILNTTRRTPAGGVENVDGPAS
jgi:hypothetical protein